MKLRIGVVTSRFNEDVTSLLEEGALATLENVENAEIDVWSVRVPGAVEIPLACKALFARGCDAVVAVGAVIRGETTHYELVCQSVERGLTQLMLETGKPIGFGVITVENDEQAAERCGGKHGNKGAEAAQVALEMIGLLKSIREAPETIPKSGKGAKSGKSLKKKTSAKKTSGKKSRKS